MKPSILYEALAGDSELENLGITDDRIQESQSIDSRPFDIGYFITISSEEPLFSPVTVLERGPRTFVIAVHTSKEYTRDYTTIDDILFRIREIFSGLEDVTGQDGCRVSQVRCRGLSGNLADDGWKTITRNATYGVLYSESTG